MSKQDFRKVALSKQDFRFRPPVSPRSLSLPLALASCLLAGAVSAQTYTVIDLATLDEGSTVVVRGLNAADTAVGAGKLTGARRGLLFARGGVQPFDGVPDSDNTVAFGINDHGSVVGGSNALTAARAFLRTASGQSRELAPLAGDTASTAFGVNNRNQAVGMSSGADGERAVSWAADGTVSVLPGVAGRSSRARAVSESGDVVGVVDSAAGARAVVWSAGGSAREIGALPGRAASEAIDINARGDIVGYSANGAGARRATLWSASGAAVDLGALAGGADSQALAINSAGVIVGTCGSAAGSRACLWRSGGAPLDLNASIPRSSSAQPSFVLTHATGINAAGVIVAFGHDVESHTHTDGQAPDHGHDDTHELPVRVFLLVPAGGPR